MMAWTILSQKDFTKKLFLEECFDDFEVSKADIITGQTFSIDGQLQFNYFEEQEQEELKEASRHYCLWKTLRPVCFSLIRGKKLPLSFRICFVLSKAQLVQEPFTALSSITNDQMGYVLNVSYTGEGLRLTSGTWNKSFSLDKEPERLWDKALTSFLDIHEIKTEEAL